MADAGRRARQSRERSQKMEEMARKMLDEATPEQRRELEQLAKELHQQDQSGPGAGTGPGTADPADTPPMTDARIDPVDARTKPPEGPAPGERVIADWYSNRPVDRNAPAGSTTPREDIRRAAESAERASEQQVIPPRYKDLIKRVFKRYSEQVPAAPPASPPAR